MSNNVFPLLCRWLYYCKKDIDDHSRLYILNFNISSPSCVLFIVVHKAHESQFNSLSLFLFFYFILLSPLPKYLQAACFDNFWKSSPFIEKLCTHGPPPSMHRQILEPPRSILWIHVTHVLFQAPIF
jgi:hypothetical protein